MRPLTYELLSNYPFGLVKNEFLVPTNWCEIVLPHPGVKACTYKKIVYSIETEPSVRVNRTPC